MFYTFSEPSTVTGLDDFYLLFRGSLKKIIIYMYIYIEFLNFIGTVAKLNDLFKSTICTTVHVYCIGIHSPKYHSLNSSAKFWLTQ